MKQLLLLILMVVYFTPAYGQSPATIKEQRQAAANRPRRLIMDNDGNEAVTMKALTAEEFLKQRTSALAGTGLDCIFYCSNATFTLSTRPTKVWQLRDYRLSGRPDAYSTAELGAAGIDPLKLVVKFGRKNHIEVFSSIRVNDVHDHSATADYGPPMFKHNAFKQAHPEWLLGTAAKKSKTGAWSAVNYLIPEVRDKFFAYVEEACRDYDIDGVSLDFFRHSAYFPSTFAGKPATAEELAAMTELMHRIRKMIDEVSAKRGRPILLSIRVPDSVDYCKAIGLDLERWLQDGLIDLLVVTGYFQLNDWSTTATLAKKHGVKAYASLDESRIKDEPGKKARTTKEAYRGRAAAVWQAGLDGIVLFNFFDPKSTLWKELGDANTLTKLDKDYFASVRGIVGSNGGNLPYGPFQKVETLNPSNPKNIAPGKEAAARIMLGTLSPAPAERTIRFRFRTPPPLDQLSVTINGQTIELQASEDGWIHARTVPSLKAGLNHVTVKLAGGSRQPVDWLDLVVHEQTGK